jgi:hypothetical protein
MMVLYWVPIFCLVADILQEEQHDHGQHGSYLLFPLPFFRVRAHVVLLVIKFPNFATLCRTAVLTLWHAFLFLIGLNP